MISRDRKQVRQALGEHAAARGVRTERLGEAAAPVYVGGLPSAANILVGKVVSLHNKDGDAYTDYQTDGWVSVLKCNPWSIKNAAAGTRELWIACRKVGRFGLQSTADDGEHGVAVDDLVAYIPSRQPIEVPGQQPEDPEEDPVYFDGVFEPMDTSHLSGVNESGYESFWAHITAVGESPGEYTFLRLGTETTGDCVEVNNNGSVRADSVSGAGAIVRIFARFDSTEEDPTWCFEYDGAGVWATLGSPYGGGYNFTADLGDGNALSGLAFEVNGRTGISAGTIVRIFEPVGAGYQFEYSGVSADDFSEGPGIDLDSSEGPIKISLSIDVDYALDFSSGDEAAQKVRVRTAALGGLGLVVEGAVPGAALAVNVDTDQGLAIGTLIAPPLNTIYVKVLKDGADFSGGLMFSVTGCLQVFCNTQMGMGVDSDGLYIILAEDSSLGFNGPGELTHVLQAVSQGPLVTGVSGENLKMDPEAYENDLFDPAGHFNSSAQNNTMHDTPGTPVYVEPADNFDHNRAVYDANGHCCGWYGWWDDAWHWLTNPWGKADPELI